MAKLNSIPDKLTVLINYSQTAAIGNSAQFKLVPKNPDGSIIDCSTYNSNVINYQTTTPSGGTTYTNNPIQTILGDATGIVLGLNQSECATLAGAMTNASVAASVSLDDGTNQLVAGVGTLNLKVTP